MDATDRWRRVWDKKQGGDHFVSSRKERIEQAKEDWKQGRILLPPTDNAEYISLPVTNSKPAGGPRPNALS